MSFILFGAGMNDHLTLDQALIHQVRSAISSVDPIHRTRRVEDTDDQSAEQPPGQQGSHRHFSPQSGAALGTYEAVKKQTLREVGPVQFAAQIMTEPVRTLLPNSTIRDLRNLFDRYDIGSVPLLDEQKSLVGIVTKGDLTSQRIRFTDLAPRPVFSIASPNVLTATTNTNIRELARVLLAQDIRGIPIVDENRHVVGIVTRGDILKSLVNYAPLELWL
ncbi:MAG: CBS domain-containing protein [Halothiobacillus sp.]|jgi:acetoin utilization protein AcuB|uniref:CBS domain-containing protein n=1 Tax=Halothiobacillus sp. TaxID=1891311 RepID=UPI002AD1F2BC|nr:CBS domain-containing protein [Halothiobacillus sp.]MDA3875785.1 CBS domain-containing protein [Halothiobacillus sp.]